MYPASIVSSGHYANCSWRNHCLQGNFDGTLGSFDQMLKAQLNYRKGTFVMWECIILIAFS